MPAVPAVVDALNTVLANTYALAVKTHAAHWNVQGAGFFALHDAFSKQYEDLLDAADELAERLRALGQRAPAGLKAIATAATLRDHGNDGGAALCGELRDDHRTLAAACAAALKTAQTAGDEATADLLIGRIDSHDKTAWMLAAAAA
ncbi:DNA starvation/stationary phase protection protein [Planctomycetota bacterium]|nr:DNA starvation/stationary phase protection protein [Planctomycetota bacterium]